VNLALKADMKRHHVFCPNIQIKDQLFVKNLLKILIYLILTKKKFLVPYELTMGEFLHVIRKRMRLNAQDALFLFVNEQIITGSAIIGHIYEALRDPDGFLYIYYAKESTFG